MENSTTYSTYYKRRIAVASIITIVVVILSYLLGTDIDNGYDYTCPMASVTVEQGETLASITERYCEGHTLQASWDIAEKRGTSAVDIGDIIHLGGK
jgi:hypothetical protein